MNKSSNKLDRLKKKQWEIKTRIQLLEAAETTREMKREKRRMFLVGAYYLDKATQEKTMEALKDEIDFSIKRDSDRALFDLCPLINPKCDQCGKFITFDSNTDVNFCNEKCYGDYVNDRKKHVQNT